MKDADKQPATRTLIIQLGSSADVIQSLMALRATNQLYSNIEFSLLVREELKEVVERVPWIKSIFTLDVPKVLEPVFSGKQTELEGMSTLATWIAPLVEKEWDLCVNWTFSESSSYLTGLIPATEKLGYTRQLASGQLELVCADDWSHYVLGILQSEVKQNIHVTDIWTTQLLTFFQIQQGPSEVDHYTSVTSKGFFEPDPERVDFSWEKKGAHKKWIAVDLVSFQKECGWTLQEWETFLKFIVKRHPDYNVLILTRKARSSGFASELLRMLSRFDLEPDRVIALNAESNFDQLVAICSRCHWMFGAEAPLVHLSSLLGTRVLYLANQTRAFRENGPYGNGHYVMAAGPTGVAPELVYGSWAFASSEWSHQGRKKIVDHFRELGWSDMVEGVDIYRSRVRTADEGGGVVYELQVPRVLHVDEWFSVVMGQIARNWYCGWTAPIGFELEREMIDPLLVKKLRELKESVDVYQKLIGEAVGFAGLLHEKTKNLPSQSVMKMGDKEQLEEWTKKLHELDQLMDRVSNVVYPLNAFSKMARVMMHHVGAEILSSLMEENLESYRKIQLGVNLCQEWLDHTLELARPRPISDQRSVIPLRPESTMTE